MLALLDLSKMCRICRDESDCLLDLFADSSLPNIEQETSLAAMLSKCSGCRVDRADGYPQFVCAECALATREAFRLRQQCRKSMHYFRQLRRMMVEPDDKEEPILEDLGPTEQDGTASNESILEPLYVELVANNCLVLENPKKALMLHDSNDERQWSIPMDSIPVDSSSDEKEYKEDQAEERKSSSDDSWSPSLGQKATKKSGALKRHRSNSESSSEDFNKKESKVFKCTHCPRVFSQKGNLQTHFRIHTGERPYKCNYCPKTFKQHGHLVVHVRRHTGEKPFKCSHCSYSTIQNSILKKHIKSIHKII
ncbi:hypothetical protein KR059_003543 [Drosophila kikkawai]|nr:hypothetical protein KR059_003543 [Drosophila kikkawai]